MKMAAMAAEAEAASAETEVAEVSEETEAHVVDAAVDVDVVVASVTTVMRMERRAPVPKTSDFLITSHKTTDTDP